MERRSVALTFDVDLVDWVAGQGVDELGDAIPQLLRALHEVDNVRATFFVRLDDGIARRFGRADYAFVHAARLWAIVREAGHEVAWHHHATTNVANSSSTDAEVAEADPDLLLNAVRRHSPSARMFDCTSARMGWGQHTSATLAQLANDGWRADSSAMPRPVYAWDPPLRDWSRAPTVPYRPACDDAQCASESSNPFGLWEVPMTMVPLASAADSQPDVQRYVNPAYRPDVFDRALAQVAAATPLVLICHPYECVGGREHPLYAFSMDAFRENLSSLANKHVQWTTIGGLADELALTNLSSPTEATDAYAA